MLSILAKKMSSFFIRHGMVKEENREIYDYSFEILISSIVNLGMILILSIVFHSFLNTCFFLLSFSLMRANTGGYHANTHWACILTLGMVYVLYLFGLKLILPHLLIYIIPTMCFVEIILILWLAPIEDSHKKLNKEEMVKFRKRSVFILIILEVCVLVTVIMKEMEWGYSITFGILSVSLSLLVEKIKQKKGVS